MCSVCLQITFCSFKVIKFLFFSLQDRKSILNIILLLLLSFFLDLLPGRRLEYIAADIGTNPTSSGLARKKSSLAARAIRTMTEMRDNGTIAFIGPDDVCSSEALVAAAWNLPMISYVSVKFS